MAVIFNYSCTYNNTGVLQFPTVKKRIIAPLSERVERLLFLSATASFQFQRYLGAFWVERSKPRGAFPAIKHPAVRRPPHTLSHACLTLKNKFEVVEFPSKLPRYPNIRTSAYMRTFYVNIRQQHTRTSTRMNKNRDNIPFPTITFGCHETMRHHTYIVDRSRNSMLI